MKVDITYICQFSNFIFYFVKIHPLSVGEIYIEIFFEIEKDIILYIFFIYFLFTYIFYLQILAAKFPVEHSVPFSWPIL